MLSAQNSRRSPSCICLGALLGKDDQIGALNLIAPVKRRQAAGLVKEGISISLSREADTEKALDNPDPFEHNMIAIGADRFGVVPHGVAHTHLDSLAHIHYDGVFYNGYKPDADSVLARPDRSGRHVSAARIGGGRGRTWRAYLSVARNPELSNQTTHARDRIGWGPGITSTCN